MAMHRVITLAAFPIVLLTAGPAAAAAIPVAAGSNLQAAIDNASRWRHAAAPGRGDVHRQLRRCAAASSRLTLRSSAADARAACIRVSAPHRQYAPLPAEAAVAEHRGRRSRIEPGALVHHAGPSRAAGRRANGSSQSRSSSGWSDSRQTTIAQAPHHLVLDRLLAGRSSRASRSGAPLR